MLTEKQFQVLKSENELLQIQLQDVNMMIAIREEELELLRTRASEANAMQSMLDNNLNEFVQMQQSIGTGEQINEGHSRRLEEMENELYQSIKEQIKFAETLKEFGSMEANLLDTSSELEQASTVYKKMHQMKTTLAEAQSNLEIAQLEISSLKEILAETKALNSLLMNKNV